MHGWKGSKQRALANTDWHLVWLWFNFMFVPIALTPYTKDHGYQFTIPGDDYEAIWSSSQVTYSEDWGVESLS